MRLELEHRHAADIERVARPLLVSADAALDEDDVRIAAADDVLRGIQELLQRGGQAALEDDRLGLLAQRAQQEAVLHVARAHPEDVDVIQHHIDLALVHDLAGDEHAILVGHLAGDLQAFLAQALEFVRRGTRLVGHAAQDLDAARSQRRRRLIHLLVAFHRARAGNELEFAAADRGHAVRQRDDSLLIGGLALHADLGAGILLLKRQRSAEDLAEERLDRLIRERTVVGLLQRGQHLCFAGGVVMLAAQFLQHLADLSDDSRTPVQRIENLHVDAVDLRTKFVQTILRGHGLSRNP